MKRLITAGFLIVLCAISLGCIVACSGSSNSASKSSEQLVVNDTAADKEKVFYVMLIGEDTRYGTAKQKGEAPNDPDYSDVDILMRVDMNDYRISLLSIPRDTEIQINGQTDKMNSAYYVGGPDGLIEQVENLTGVEIPYYFALTFANFAKYIDALGGVTVDVPVSMSVEDVINGGKVYINAGDGQTLEGYEALGFGRMRKQYIADHDACRQIQDRQMVASIITMVANQPASTAGDYAAILMEYAKTNMSEEQLTEYVADFMNHASQLTIQSGTGPYEGNAATGLWMVPSDPATYAQLVQAMENNTSLEAIVPLPYVAVG